MNASFCRTSWCVARNFRLSVRSGSFGGFSFVLFSIAQKHKSLAFFALIRGVTKLSTCSKQHHKINKRKWKRRIYESREKKKRRCGRTRGINHPSINRNDYDLRTSSWMYCSTRNLTTAITELEKKRERFKEKILSMNLSSAAMAHDVKSILAETWSKISDNKSFEPWRQEWIDRPSIRHNFNVFSMTKHESVPSHPFTVVMCTSIGCRNDQSKVIMCECQERLLHHIMCKQPFQSTRMSATHKPK